MRLSELLSYENNRELIIEIKENKNNIIPFIGAGISRGCGLYSWSELLEKLASSYFSEIEIEDLKKLNSLKFADKIIEKAGNTSMVMRKIRSIFNSASIHYTEIPYILLEEFSPLLVTTNYDNILETVSGNCQKGKITPLLPCLQGQVNDAIQLNERKLLKIHGSIEEPSSFVFSSEQYELSYEEDGLIARYLKRIFEGKRVLFVGCSIEEDKTIEVLKTCIEQNDNLVHYAILPRPTENNKFIERNIQLTKLGIQPIYFPENEYDDVGKLLNFLSDNNQFICFIKMYLNEIIGSTYDDSDEDIKYYFDILISIVNRAYYETAIVFDDVLDIDCKIFNINKIVQSSSVSYISENANYSLMDICLFGFESYLGLGVIRDKDKIFTYFRDVLSSEMLIETEIVDFLQKDLFSHKQITGVYDASRLLKLSDEQINKLAEKQIGIIQYKGDMNYDIADEYHLAERIINYCSGRLTFENRLQLLNRLGALSYHFNNCENGRKYLLECADMISRMGELNDSRKLFLSMVYNNLTIVESQLNSDLNSVLNYNQYDITLKREAGAAKSSLAQSIGLRATVLKEMNPFQALDLYIESSRLKEEDYEEFKGDNRLLSWMLTAFNIGLVAKDLNIYDEALRIISKANIPRLQYYDKSSKDYGSSINVECELELLLGRTVSNTDLVKAIQSRVDFPKGLIETQEHTWYVCALYFYRQKKYCESIKYINKAMYLIDSGNTSNDLRQRVRLSILLAKAKFKLKNTDTSNKSEIEQLLCDSCELIKSNYGNNSIYLMELYGTLADMIDASYAEDYNRLYALYCDSILEAREKLSRYDFCLPTC